MITKSKTIVESRTRKSKRTAVQTQSGSALMVALVLIFIMSVMGMSAMRESSLERRMATNSVHKSSTFQAAESATEIAISDPDNLALAYAKNGVSLKTTLPTSSNLQLSTEATLTFVGSGPPMGFSLGAGSGFQALRYEVQGNATINSVQSSTRISQGAYRTVPTMQQ